MTNVLSVYYSPHHWREQDARYLSLLNPAWVRIHQPTARAIAVIHANAPNAKIMLRSWDIDDHNNERKQEMYDDPIGAAHKHIDLWQQKREELRIELKRNAWAYDESKWYMGLVNEPDPAYVKQTVIYTSEAMRLAAQRGWHLGVICSSVGTFSKPEENDNGWTLVKPLASQIRQGNHILIVHEYWQPEGPNYGEDAGNLAWRHHSIPMDVPILIGEAGANGYIYGRHSKHDDAGWRRYMQPRQFALQVQEYISGCDERVEGVCLYMLDYHSEQWKMFDTEPAMNELLDIRSARPQRRYAHRVSGPSNTTLLPAVKNDNPWRKEAFEFHKFTHEQEAIVTAAALNVRVGPGVDYGIVDTLHSNTLIKADAHVTRTGHLWLRIGEDRWVADDWVTFITHSDEVEEATDYWSRVHPIVLKFEGGLSLDPNDRGNYFKGNLVGTKYGISAAAWGHHYDIPNLTHEQALGIYQEHYWRASGADKMPWPMCLIHFDTAVQFGVNTANALLEMKTSPALEYLGRRALLYMQDVSWRYHGIGWGSRVNSLRKIAESTEGELSG